MFSQVCVCSEGGPTLDGGGRIPTLDVVGVPTLRGLSLPWTGDAYPGLGGGVPALDGGTYLGWWVPTLEREGVLTLDLGVPTLDGGYLLWMGRVCLPWMGVPPWSAWIGIPPPPHPGRQSSTTSTCYEASSTPLCVNARGIPPAA